MDSRAPPPSGPPPRYNFMQRVYRYNLRPVALTCAILAWLWTLLWSIRSFQAVSGDRKSFTRVVAFDITLGALYAVACLIETFGFFAMFRQHTKLVGLYSWASVGAVVVVLAAEIIRIVLHFTLKKSLIDQCTTENTGDIVVSRGGGFWDPTTSSTLTSDEARRWCNDAWNRGTFSDFAWFIVSALLGFMFVSVNFAYWRQLLDPTSVVSRYPRAPSEQYGMGAMPNHPHPYNPYAQQQYNPYSYGQPDPFARTEYAPPYDAQKLPGYASHGFENQETRDDKDPNGPKPQA